MNQFIEPIIGIIVLSPLVAFIIYLLVVRNKQIKENKIRNNSSIKLPPDYLYPLNIKILKQDGTTEDIFDKPLPKKMTGVFTNKQCRGNLKIDPETHLPIKS